MKTSEIKISSIRIFPHSRSVLGKDRGLKPLLPPLTGKRLTFRSSGIDPCQGNDLFKPRTWIMVGKIPAAKAIKTLYQLSSISYLSCRRWNIIMKRKEKEATLLLFVI
ncbi:hypothetical protein CDAR_420421 [Caerostris darwini]|uniref:Uncharacterized protein n=1 Tax=Caerostris darwini TaxID=1538125 RepID=A0AAV4TT36_9ARAC|nr:hypothetical protein CDAR_420421 [Caerostris darwini]